MGIARDSRPISISLSLEMPRNCEVEQSMRSLGKNQQSRGQAKSKTQAPHGSSRHPPYSRRLFYITASSPSTLSNMDYPLHQLLTYIQRDYLLLVDLEHFQLSPQRLPSEKKKPSCIHSHYAMNAMHASYARARHANQGGHRLPVSYHAGTSRYERHQGNKRAPAIIQSGQAEAADSPR